MPDKTLLEDVESEHIAKRFDALLDEIAELKQAKSRRPAAAPVFAAYDGVFGPQGWMNNY
jgi:hypothetical protein